MRMKQKVTALVVDVDPFIKKVYLGTPQPYVDLNPKQTKKLIKALQAALIALKENKNKNND